MGRLQLSTENRNWNSIKGLWQLKEFVKAEGGDVAKAFTKATAADVLAALKETKSGLAFIADKLDPYLAVFGYKSMWAHEFSFKTWKEDPRPVIEAVRGYLETDYDFHADVARVVAISKPPRRRSWKGFPQEKVVTSWPARSS